MARGKKKSFLREPRGLRGGGNGWYALGGGALLDPKTVRTERHWFVRYMATIIERSCVVAVNARQLGRAVSSSSGSSASRPSLMCVRTVDMSYYVVHIDYVCQCASTTDLSVLVRAPG
jgi:hypothetical protein